MPSLAEGFPIALLEAMASARACIASDVGDVSKVVVHEETGLLVAPGDSRQLASALSLLLPDAARRRDMGARARELVVERFSSRAMARSYCSLYDELFVEPRPSA